MTDLKLHGKIALTYFMLAAVFGVVLRSFHSMEITINYKFIVHTHSHIALLGWVYVALTTLLYKLYLNKPGLDKKYQNLFLFTQITLVGMLLTFPFQGYALFSIIFSTLFLFASYWFAWFFQKNARAIFKKTHSYKCIRAALWYLVVSSLGPWALGAIMNTLGGESIWYRLAIYFYLHFLYNGWMILALVGLLLYVMERQQIYVPDKKFKKLFWSMNVGIVLSYFLSTLFTHPPLSFYFLGGLGILLQLPFYLLLLKALMNFRDRLRSVFSPFRRKLLKTVIALLAVKMLLQLVTSIPYFANLASSYLDFTIGYLHLTFLGVVTIGLFLFLEYFGLLKVQKKTYLLYLTGFFLTEALIFYKGIAAWQNLSLFNSYFEVLAIGSFLIPLSLIMFIFSNGNRKDTNS